MGLGHHARAHSVCGRVGLRNVPDLVVGAVRERIGAVRRGGAAELCGMDGAGPTGGAGAGADGAWGVDAELGAFSGTVARRRRGGPGDSEDLGESAFRAGDGSEADRAELMPPRPFGVGREGAVHGRRVRGRARGDRSGGGGRKGKQYCGVGGRATENVASRTALLDALIERGLRTDPLNAGGARRQQGVGEGGARSVRKRAVIQRCQILWGPEEGAEADRALPSSSDAVGVWGIPIGGDRKSVV